MTTIICAFLSGFLVATLILWSFHRKQQKDWQAEYRRLMAGIKKAWVDLDKPNMPTSFVTNDLRKLFYNEHLCLRK